MDIALKFKRVVATVAAGAIFASSAGAALAQTFNDVSTDAWYYDFVEQLVDNGVIDADDNYNPALNLNRAELVKMAVVAIDGLAGYEAPATPTFEDVAPDAWFYDYVEAASQLGIVNGYTDANGNLTGFFGPSDLVNRAAATKTLVNAFSVPTDLSPASVFPDVSAGDWFYEYVTTAYNQSIVDGYANGNFGPADFVTRAQIAKLLVNSQNPVERMSEEEEEEEEEEMEEEEEETSSSSDGDLEVSLNDNTPASSTLPISANGVALASFDFTADSDDVLITNLVVTRGGVGNNGNWAGIYLYHGANRLTTSRTINNDMGTITLPLDVLVEAGTTVSLTLVGDVADASEADPSSQHYFYVASAADVTSNAQSVAGDFPVAGNTFTMGGASTVVNTVLIEEGTAPSKVTLGELDAEIASMRIEAGSENDVAVHQLALTNGGALASSKLANLTLLRGTDVVASAEGFMNDIVTFVLDTPYVIEEGQTKTFYVNADIIGGRTTDNIVLYLDEDTDLVAIDQQYGFGAAIDNQFTQGLANTVNLEGGDVTVTDNGPAATQLATDSTNNELLNVSVTSGRDLTVRDTQVLVHVQDPAGNEPSYTAGNVTTTGALITSGGACPAGEFDVDVAAPAGFADGDMFQMGSLYGRVTDITSGADFCAASASDLTAVALGTTVTEVNPYTYVEDVKVVDLNTGATLAGPLTEADDAELCTGVGTPQTICSTANTYAEVFTEDFELTGGETRHLSIVVDLEEELVTGYQISAAIQWPDTGAGFSSIKDHDANESVQTSEVIGAGNSALSGDLMIITENSLDISVASTPTSNDYVRGDESVPALGISMTAGDAGDINLRRLDVRVYANSAAGVWADAEGDLAADTLVSSVTLYDGNDIVDGPEGIDLVGTGAFTPGTDYYVAQFDDLDMVIPAGSTQTLTARVSLLKNNSATTYIALDVDPSEMTVEDDDSDTVEAAGGQLNGTTTKSPLVTILPSGSLTASSEGNPDADILVEGSTEQLVAKYKFSAVDEDFMIETITIVNDSNGGDFDSPVLTSAISDITLKFPDVNGVTQSASSSLSGAGTAKFSGPNFQFYAPAGQDVFLEVYADVSDSDGEGASLSGKKFRLGIMDVGNTISTFEAIGQSSSINDNFSDDDEISNAAQIEEFVVRENVPVFSQNAVANNKLTSTTMELFDVDVTVDGAGSVDLVRLAFDISVNDADAGGELTLDDFVLNRDGSPVDVSNVAITKVSDGSDLSSVGGSTITADDQVIVAYLTSDPVVGSARFELEAAITGVEDSDSVTVELRDGDETVEINSMTVVVNDNTAELVNAGATLGLFATPTTYQDTLATAGALPANVVWSDTSAEPHNFSTVSTESSADYTNGYLLDVNELDPVTLSEDN